MNLECTGRIPSPPPPSRRRCMHLLTLCCAWLGVCRRAWSYVSRRSGDSVSAFLRLSQSPATQSSLQIAQGRVLCKKGGGACITHHRSCSESSPAVATWAMRVKYNATVKAPICLLSMLFWLVPDVPSVDTPVRARCCCDLARGRARANKNATMV